MAWTASVINVQKTEGLVKVTVEYTDGVSPFYEVYQAKAPGPTWIPDNVRNRIALLDAADAVVIPLGSVTPSDPPDPPDPPVPVDPEESLFMRRMEILQTVKVLIDLGYVPASNPKVVALGSWITARMATYFDKFAE